jgi:hypothetical protein
MSDYDTAQANAERMRRAGQVYQDRTVLRCPWPGCDRDAVSGWSACGFHFKDMHPDPPPQRRAAPVEREQNYTAHLKTPWIIFRALLQPDADVVTCIAMGEV